MFSSGISIMILGMGIVFSFLIIIYLTMICGSFFVEKYYQKYHPASGTEVNFETQLDNNVIAAISAAVNFYNKK